MLFTDRIAIITLSTQTTDHITRPFPQTYIQAGNKVCVIGIFVIYLAALPATCIAMPVSEAHSGGQIIRFHLVFGGSQASIFVCIWHWFLVKRPRICGVGCVISWAGCESGQTNALKPLTATLGPPTVDSITTRLNLNGLSHDTLEYTLNVGLNLHIKHLHCSCVSHFYIMNSLFSLDACLLLCKLPHNVSLMPYGCYV